MTNIMTHTTKNYTEEQIAQMNAFTVGRNKAVAVGGEVWRMIHEELQAKLGNISQQALNRRINGFVVHSQFERDGIEAVFRKYGINEIWGKA